MKPKSQYLDVIYIENDTSEKALVNSYKLKKSLYGISKEDYLRILEEQDFKCGSCKEDATGSEHTLCVDHDHNTNEIRGLLCSGCNTAAGWLDDDPAKAEQLANYLRSSGTNMFVPYHGD